MIRRTSGVGLLATALLLAGCAGGDDIAAGETEPATEPTTAATTSTQPTTTAPAPSMRGERYCEVLLVSVNDGQASADVYNSYPMNACPQEQWAALDAAAIAADARVPLALLNGPRYWLMDRVEKVGGIEQIRQDFGGIEMDRQANVVIGSLAGAAIPYQPRQVDRDTVFTFDTGQTVYELVAPDGSTYVMQAWSQQVDPALDEAGLATLGDRLALPPGWTYRTRTLTAPLRVVTTDRPATVLQDELRNSYSLET